MRDWVDRLFAIEVKSVASSIDAQVTAVCQGAKLSEQDASELFEAILSGKMDDARIESVLVAMADRGESVEEIVGAARVMRQHVTPIVCEYENAIDTCGTGGDGVSTFNVSTVAAIVAAAAGAKVAKHGNRSFTRASGSAEVLTELGVNVDASPFIVARCLREVGICFLHAARLHPAMARVAEVRRRIGRRTLFNLLGPLTNPAGVRRQIIGVPRDEWLEPIAQSLLRLGCKRAMVVCGHGPLCDLSITGSSRCVSLMNGQLSIRRITPAELGLSPGSLDDLRVDSPRQSAEAIRAILDGQQGPRRDHTLLNAAAALEVAGVANSLRHCIELSASAIDTASARQTLEELVRVSWNPG